MSNDVMQNDISPKVIMPNDIRPIRVYPPAFSMVRWITNSLALIISFGFV